MIVKIFPSGPIETNAILLSCPQTKEALIFDPSFDSALKLIEAAAKEKLSIKAIYLTHGHWDHIGDLFFLKQHFQLPVYVHQEDCHLVTHPPSFMGLSPKSVIPDSYVTDDQIINFGQSQMKVIHTPGHTSGGVCYYFEKEKLLISGDTFFKGTMGRVDFPESSPEKMERSLKKLSTLPTDTRVIPGHGPETTIQNEKWIKDPMKLFK